MTAGIEGGCKAAIEAGWSIDEIDQLRGFWCDHAPPVFITAQRIAFALGLKSESGPSPSATSNTAEMESDLIAFLQTAASRPYTPPQLAIPIGESK